MVYSMKREKDLYSFIGKKFGRLTILDAFRDDGKIYVKCVCDCGSVKNKILIHNLVKGKTKSCGCLQKEMDHKAHFKHGLKDTPTYRVWTGMHGRCFNKQNHAYKDYGGRGITVCEHWKHSFLNFLADMGEKPKGKSIDRIDNNGNYSPENCRWATPKEQSKNRRTNRVVEYNGNKILLIDLAERSGLGYSTLWNRIVNSNKPVERAADTPIRAINDNVNHVEYNGKIVTIEELSKLTGVEHALLNNRIIHGGWSINSAIKKPKKNMEFFDELENLSKTTGIPYRVLRVRVILRGWSLERAGSTPLRDYKWTGFKKAGSRNT